MVTQISSNVNSTEINGIASRAVTSIKASGTMDEVIVGLNKTLEKDNDKLTLAVKRKTGNDATPVINLLESRRDKGLKSIFKTVEGACFRLKDDVSDAGKLLKAVIKRHGSTMYDLPQDEQTSVMASFITELKEPVLVAALELTGTTIPLAETIEANNLYLTELGKRGSDKAKKEDPELIGDNMKKVKVGMSNLMNYLYSYLAAKENATLKTLYIELCDVIDKANAIIKARDTRKSSKKGNGTEPETK